MFSFTKHIMHFTQDEREEKVYVGGIKIFIEKRKAVLSSSLPTFYPGLRTKVRPEKEKKLPFHIPIRK